MNYTPEHSETTDNRQVGEVAASLTSLLCRYDDVAYVIGVKQGRTVKNWAEKGTVPADPLAEKRMRVAEALAATVRQEQRPWVSDAWLISCNPHLREDSPAEMIQAFNGSLDDDRVIAELQSAAESFAAHAD